MTEVTPSPENHRFSDFFEFYCLTNTPLKAGRICLVYGIVTLMVQDLLVPSVVRMVSVALPRLAA